MKISITPSMPTIEHVVLNPGDTYKMGDFCTLKEWKIADKGLSAHFIIYHAENCYCPSQHHPSEVIPPPPSYASEQEILG